MDYEKILKEALDNSSTPFEVQSWIEEQFPELKESEDKRIRKRLIEYFHSFLDGYEDTYKVGGCVKWEGLDVKDVIAWLEKQGEKEFDPRYKYLKELLRADDIYQMAMNDAMAQEAKTKAIDALSKLEIGNLLEIEKQGEQKPADKVEPKFKIGDWIVYYKYGENDIDKIVKFDNDKVSFESGTWLYIDQLNEDCKLWTIQDAKDGDILAHSDKNRFKHDWIGIFKEYNNSNDSVSTYCYMSHDNTKFYINEDNIDPKDLKPATKEQCYQLEKAMTDAGYKWNKEEYKLEKI